MPTAIEDAELTAELHLLSEDYLRMVIHNSNRPYSAQLVDIARTELTRRLLTDEPRR